MFRGAFIHQRKIKAFLSRSSQAKDTFILLSLYVAASNDDSLDTNLYKNRKKILLTLFLTKYFIFNCHSRSLQLLLHLKKIRNANVSRQCSWSFWLKRASLWACHSIFCLKPVDVVVCTRILYSKAHSIVVKK